MAERYGYGTVIRGWVVCGHLADGGMGRAYIVRSRDEERVGVMKVATENHYPVDMPVLHEAEVMRSYGTHPGLPTLYDAWEDDGIAHLVMEFMEGEGSNVYCQWLMRRPLALVFRSVAEYLRGILRPLAHLHALSEPATHMDVKPNNILRTDSGQMSLIDFGLSHRANYPYYASHFLVGTLQYCAPELQRATHAPHPRADVFAAGLIGYYLVVRKMAPDRNPDRHYIGSVPRIDATEVSCPEQLVRAINRATIDIPEERFQSAQEFLDALNDC
jgi:serine/threonine-protein kinase